MVDEIFKRTALVLRELGFRGSGQNYRKVEDDFVFVVNFQRSRSGDSFYVNLGAQPTFIPAEGDAALKTLKEYECVWRRRVGTKWPQQLSDSQFQSFVDELVTSQHAFFDHAKSFRTAVATEPPEALLTKFSAGSTRGRAALHLARAALALEHSAVARELATLGLSLAKDRAALLEAELEDVLARC